MVAAGVKQQFNCCFTLCNYDSQQLNYAEKYYEPIFIYKVNTCDFVPHCTNNSRCSDI